MLPQRLLKAVVLSASLAACTGGYDGVGAVPEVIGGGAGTPQSCAKASSENDHFSRNVQPTLAFCRNCHVPGGISDTDRGRRFMLSDTGADDLAALRASWERLGKDPQRILDKVSGAQPHSGGAPWPEESVAYKSMDALLGCFGDPAGCAARLATACDGVATVELPLLGSKHAQHAWSAYCEGKPDGAALPADPRTLIRPGVNAGKAVYYNAWYEDCHVKQAHPDEVSQRPKNCGEFRAKVAAGRAFLLEDLPTSGVAPADFRASWSKWGTEAPASEDEFQRMYTLRYGWNAAPYDNPYPPAAGVKGQLPLGMHYNAQTGQVESGACFQCHGGRVGDPVTEAGVMTMDNFGMGNNNYDVLMVGRDGSPFRQIPAVGGVVPASDPAVLFNLGVKQRGQNNAVGAFEVLITLLDLDNLGLNPNAAKTTTPAMMDPGPGQGVVDVSHPLAHTQDTPQWWNFGSRPRKFFDAGVSVDSTRIIMAAGPDEFSSLFSQDGKAYRDRIEKWDEVLSTYFLSLRSPPWPEAILGAIDTKLAERGAILFHSKDLWDPDLHNPVPKPAGGNGSCASCHGAYSPRYVNDPRYLQSPTLEGVAGHIATLDVIRTDTARSDMLTPSLRYEWDSTYWAYPEGQDGYVDPADKDPFTEAADDMAPDATKGACGWEKEVIGYLAPPLYGVWATGPYFHNGSVPTLEQVLDSRKRAPIWQRRLQTIKGVTGFDQRLYAAFDKAAVGWKNTPLACADMPGTEQMNCNPADAQGPSLPEMMTNFLNGTVSWTAFAAFDDPAPDAFDKRLVYDTRILGNGGGGHDFADVLTGDERKAIIEYLKTL